MKIHEDTIEQPNHEEALKLIANWLHALRNAAPHSVRTLALERLMSDIRKMHMFLQLLAEVDNQEGNRHLSRTADYSKYRDPHIAKQVREFIQEL